MGGRRLVWAALVTGLLAWGLYTPPAPRPLFPVREPESPADLGAAFDPARCGTVRGMVAWTGEVPAVQPIQLIHAQIAPDPRKVFPNPNAPRVAAGRLADAFVYLTAVDPQRSAAWTLPPATVEATRAALVVRQGDRAGRAAVVRRGDGVRLLAGESALHSVRARGVEFFTQMLPNPDRPVTRKFTEAGIVELSSGSGYYWLRGYLLVSDHPYAAVTGPDGGFHFPPVPDGAYEAVCWVANWQVERIENDPELVAPVRLYFRPAVEKRQKVVVVAGAVKDLGFSFSAADFDRPGHMP